MKENYTDYRDYLSKDIPNMSDYINKSLQEKMQFAKKHNQVIEKLNILHKKEIPITTEQSTNRAGEKSKNYLTEYLNFNDFIDEIAPKKKKVSIRKSANNMLNKIADRLAKHMPEPLYDLDEVSNKLDFVREDVSFHIDKMEHILSANSQLSDSDKSKLQEILKQYKKLDSNLKDYKKELKNISKIEPDSQAKKLNSIDKGIDYLRNNDLHENNQYRAFLKKQIENYKLNKPNVYNRVKNSFKNITNLTHIRRTSKSPIGMQKNYNSYQPSGSNHTNTSRGIYNSNDATNTKYTPRHPQFH